MTNIESNLPWPNKQTNKVDFRVFILWDHNFVVDSGSWRPTGNRFKKSFNKKQTFKTLCAVLLIFHISNYPFSSLYFAQIVWLFWQVL